MFTIGIVKDRLDAPIKRVGFIGTDNHQPMQIEVQPAAEYDNGIWDLEFELYEDIMRGKFHRIKGSFFVETTINHYYWLKDKGSMDFEFDSDSRLVLNDWYPMHS